MRTNGKVKWFDPVKGLGFVITDEGITALLDRPTLTAVGRETIADGTPVVVDIALGNKGLMVTRVHSVGEPPQPGAGLPLSGTCKWFSRSKGYGFIAPANGGEDVFVEMDALRKANMRKLWLGQRVVFDAARGRKGLTVTRIAAA